MFSVRVSILDDIEFYLNDSNSFKVSFAVFSEMTNDERTRTFLTMEVGAGHHEVRLHCDRVAEHNFQKTSILNCS